MCKAKWACMLTVLFRNTHTRSAANMQLFVRAQEAHLVEFAEAATIADVKAFVAQAEGIPAAEQVICYAGVPLEDAAAVASFQSLAALDVTARLVGGMLLLSFTY